MLLSEHSCASCKEIFKSEHALNQHTENLHAFASIFCKSCRKVVRLEESHHHHNFLYYCKICHSYVTADIFLEHKCFHKISSQVRARKSKVICDKCKGIFFSKKDLIDHIQECQILNNILCCKCCKKEFLSSGDLGLHINSIKELECYEEEFTCSQCQLIFDTKDFLKNHIKSNHFNSYEPVLKKRSKSKQYNCRFCQKQFTYKNDMTSHEKLLHSSDVITCSICQKEMPFRRLGPHSRWHRTREKYKTKPRKVCDVCGFASKFITRHMKIHKEERRYKCNICSKSFKLSSCLSNHKLVHSDVARHKCNVCDKAFKSNFNLQVHLRSHDVVKPFPCVVCEKTFTTKQSRDNHLKTHDREKGLKRYVGKLVVDQGNYLCNECGKKFTKRKSWAAHKTRHERRKQGIRFPCEVCGVIFLDKKNVEIHRRKVHLNDFQYCCEQCGRAFVCKSHLNRHVKMTHEEQKLTLFRCQFKECNESFRSKATFRYHLLKHEEINYTCNLCYKIFRHPYRLKIHVKNHHANRPRKMFQCKFCDLQVTTKLSLRDHTRTHTGEKPFICEQCGQNFTTNQQLKTHTVVHTKEKPFACTICDKKFTQRGTLSAHMKSTHVKIEIKS